MGVLEKRRSFNGRKAMSDGAATGRRDKARGHEEERGSLRWMLRVWFRVWIWRRARKVTRARRKRFGAEWLEEEEVEEELLLSA